MNIELVLAAILCACLGVLLMYGSVRDSAPFVCESRRSIVLMDAARKEAERDRRRARARRPADKRVIYLHEEWERLWWSDHLGVDIATLEAAVRAVGPTAAEIERYLRRAAQVRRRAPELRWSGAIASY